MSAPLLFPVSKGGSPTGVSYQVNPLERDQGPDVPACLFATRDEEAAADANLRRLDLGQLPES
jgi:hypothetical protein